MKQFTKLAILFSIVLSLGCKKENPESVPPFITFMDAQISGDGSSTVRFEFVDGDGDLGLKQEENTGEQKANVFVDYYEKVNGTWILKSPIITYTTSTAQYDTFSLDVRMPFIENESGRALEGDVKVDLLFDSFKFAQTPGADTFRYDIRIKDRALHLSNLISTSDLIAN